MNPEGPKTWDRARFRITLPEAGHPPAFMGFESELPVRGVAGFATLLATAFC